MKKITSKEELAAMENPNLHIEDYLDYYYSMQQEPGYAVLLKGAWGAGKTWFIKKNLNQFSDNGGKYLYVSLYGVRTFSEIEDEFFKQLHPLLSSKSMTLAGKIAKGLLKGTLKIDLDRDGKDDGNASLQIPELNLPEYLTNTSEYLLVFDDLERSTMDLEILLGYINHYVEHQGHKVIVLANEDEILKAHDEKSDSPGKPYRRIKEKLIGKTFEVAPDLTGAIKNFVADIKSEPSKALFKENISTIIEIHESSEYKNLRHLKQSLWDFERFCQNINPDAAEKPRLLETLLKIFLALSFEIKSGTILPKDILTFRSEFFTGHLSDDNKENEDTPYKRVNSKYGDINFSDLVIEESIWVDIFDKGVCSADKVRESLEKSEFFRSENTPDWIVLWHANELEDEDFQKALDSVRKNFHEMKYEDVGIVKHITGILLWLAKCNLTRESEEDILSFAFSYVDHLKESNKLDMVSSDSITPAFNESWGGLGFHGDDTQQFKRLSEYIVQASSEALIESHPKDGNKLIELIHSDPDMFYRKVTGINHEGMTYRKIPIFHYTDAAHFVNVFSSATPRTRRIVGYAFKDRYKVEFYNSSLLPELDWLKSMIGIIKNELRSREGLISGIQIQSVLEDSFQPALDNLQKFSLRHEGNEIQ